MCKLCKWTKSRLGEPVAGATHQEAIAVLEEILRTGRSDLRGEHCEKWPKLGQRRLKQLKIMGVADRMSQ
jgi:hypothetical protein